MKFNLENIRKIWVLVGSVLTALNLAFMPEWLNNLFGVEGTALVFAFLTAGITLYQFTTGRMGDAAGDGVDEPLEYKEGKKSKLAYLWPFKKA